jgi:protein-S-isoprenylcysteine O-methyltransferase Ste14
MALKDELERSGERLFRWRSYPPVLFFGVVLWGMRDFSFPRGSHVLEQLWEVMCLVPVIAGCALRMWAIGTAAPNTSGGNRSGQIAEELNTTGAYSMVRHPLYLGVLLIWTGVAMFPRSFEVLLIVWLLFWVYYERIMMAEESFLARKFGASFEAWSARTPALIPRVRGYRSSRYPYSMRMALRREYSAWLAAATPLFILELYGSYVIHGRVVWDRAWVIGFLAVIVLSGVVRSLKHYTRVLKTR